MKFSNLSKKVDAIAAGCLFVAVVGTVAILARGVFTIATAVQLVLLVVVGVQMATLPLHNRRVQARFAGHMAELEKAMREFEAAAKLAELAAIERGELNAWREFGKRHGVSMTFQPPSVH